MNELQIYVHGDHGPLHGISWCPDTRINQIISSYHRTFKNIVQCQFRIPVVTQISWFCLTNGMIFSSKCTIHREPIARFRWGPAEGKRGRGGEGKGWTPITFANGSPPLQIYNKFWQSIVCQLPRSDLFLRVLLLGSSLLEHSASLVMPRFIDVGAQVCWWCALNNALLEKIFLPLPRVFCLSKNPRYVLFIFQLKYNRDCTCESPNSRRLGDEVGSRVRQTHYCSVAVLEESPCPRRPIHKSLSLDYKYYYRLLVIVVEP